MRSRPKHQTRKLPSVVDAKGASAHLILNRAAGNAAALLERLTRAARERGIRVRAGARGGRDTRRPRGTVALLGGFRCTPRA